MFTRLVELFTDNVVVSTDSGASIVDQMRGLDIRGLCEKAMNLMLAKSYPDALTYLDEAIRRPISQENTEELSWQRNAHILRAMNNLYISTYAGIIEQALKDLKAVYSADQNHPVSLMCESLVLAQQAKPNEAKEVYSRAFRRIDSVPPEANLLLGLRLVHGEILRLLKFNKLALEDFEEANRLKPNNPFILSRMGLASASSRKFEEAKTILELALEQCQLKGVTVPLIQDSAQRTLENVKATLSGQVPPHGRFRSSSASSGASSGGAAGGGVAAPAPASAASAPEQQIKEVQASVRKSIRIVGQIGHSLDVSQTTPAHRVDSPHPNLPQRHRAVPSAFGPGAAAPAAQLGGESAPAVIPSAIAVTTTPAVSATSHEMTSASAISAAGRPPRPSPTAHAQSAAAKEPQETSSKDSGLSVRERMKAFAGPVPKPQTSGTASPQARPPAPAASKSSPTGTSSPSAVLLARQNLSPQNKALAGTAASSQSQGQGQAPMQATVLAQNRVRGGSAGMAAARKDQDPAPRK
ncbi:MAG: hypothetical protein K0R66_154 [Gammaproteobacteria bacterium]|jgi:tetratricopeptide (TPR) repeat protein|nr:hypothetical protein [Gammaproteobacteria bacterium]